MTTNDDDRAELIAAVAAAIRDCDEPDAKHESPYTAEARAAIAAMEAHASAPAIAWTTERPTEPGVYWTRTDPHDCRLCVVDRINGRLRVVGDVVKRLRGWRLDYDEEGCPVDEVHHTYQWQRAEPRP